MTNIRRSDPHHDTADRRRRRQPSRRDDPIDPSKPGSDPNVAAPSSESPALAPRTRARNARSPRSPLPRWDNLSATLTFRETIVRKRGRKSAPLVETILQAFEAARWARYIIAPLPPGPGDRHQQLMEAIRRLNKSLQGDLIRFHVRESVVSWEDLGAKQAPSAPA